MDDYRTLIFNKFSQPSGKHKLSCLKVTDCTPFLESSPHHSQPEFTELVQTTPPVSTVATTKKTTDEANLRVKRRTNTETTSHFPRLVSSDSNNPIKRKRLSLLPIDQRPPQLTQSLLLEQFRTSSPFTRSHNGNPSERVNPAETSHSLEDQSYLSNFTSSYHQPPTHGPETSLPRSFTANTPTKLNARDSCNVVKVHPVSASNLVSVLQFFTSLGRVTKHQLSSSEGYLLLAFAHPADATNILRRSPLFLPDGSPLTVSPADRHALPQYDLTPSCTDLPSTSSTSSFSSSSDTPYEPLTTIRYASTPDGGPLLPLPDYRRRFGTSPTTTPALPRPYFTFSLPRN